MSNLPWFNSTKYVFAQDKTTHQEFIVWTVQESNLRPSACKADALPAELTVQFYSLSNHHRDASGRNRTYIKGLEDPCSIH